MSELKKVLGFKTGDFTPENGETLHYIHLYCAFPKEDVTGLAVETYKVASDDVLEGIQFGDYVELYFNDKKRVVLINKLPATDENKALFYDAEPNVDTITEE